MGKSYSASVAAEAGNNRARRTSSLKESVCIAGVDLRQRGNGAGGIEEL